MGPKYHNKAVLAAFYQSLKHEELAIAYKIWLNHEDELTCPAQKDTTLDEFVDSFERSPFYLEVKIFFIMQEIHKMSTERVDKILLTLEDRFGDLEPDGSNSYILCNLSPVKTACHIMLLLYDI